MTAIRRRTLFGCLCLAGAPGLAAAQSHPEFGYSGAKGPVHWGGISEHWSACSVGRNQSPVDLTGLVDATLPPVTFDYASFALDVINNGHTILVNHRPGSTLRVGDNRFTLQQFHFHAPSEHHLDGRDFAMEAHLVHADAAGNLAVVAVMLEEGAPNDLIGLLWAAMPQREGERSMLGNGLSARGLLPAAREHFRYNGSLTTPPCSEGVLWIVMRTPMSVSRQQVAAFEQALGFANNRPVQPANARLLLRGR
jgi:carbonic anhydrase